MNRYFSRFHIITAHSRPLLGLIYDSYSGHTRVGCTQREYQTSTDYTRGRHSPPNLWCYNQRHKMWTAHTRATNTWLYRPAT